MIWVIANSKEEDGTFPTYKFYKNVFDNNEIDIYCARENDDFSFLKKDDIVFMRTREDNIVNRVREIQPIVGFASTLESQETNYLTHDKDAVKSVLRENGIAFPKTIKPSDVVDGRKYFIKPKFGENSFGIDENSICYSKSHVIEKYNSLIENEVEPIIEEYIEGYDLTTAVIYSRKDNTLEIYSAVTQANNDIGIQTDETKKNYTFKTSIYKSELLDEISKKVFEIVYAKHYLRIDFRMSNGIPYVIDINMIPGLAPIGYMSLCMKENGFNYHEFIRKVVYSSF